ncbi:hypothetical protein [Pseudaestuariivita sp.]|uniref:hypothetical protein n=1 Tax=Pseudaestuariivita sp. TaxID=2211669 RepID=UPI00405835A5
MTVQAELSDVIYNAAEQAFEAVVTLPTSRGPLRYAASFPAPITLDFDAATAGLVTHAERMHRLNRGMRAGAARRMSLPKPLPRRDGRQAYGQWLETLITKARAA